MCSTQSLSPAIIDQMVACMKSPPESSPTDQYQDLLHQIAHKASQYANTPREGLSWAATVGSQCMVEYFISKGANNLIPALCLASREGHFAIVKYLFEHHNAGISEGVKAALGCAASRGHLSIVQYIIARSSPTPDRLDHSLAWAIEGGHVSVVLCLLEAGANDLNNGLFYAGLAGQLLIIQCLLALGATQISGALYGAAANGHLPVVQYLVDRAAVTNTSLDLSCAIDAASRDNRVKVLAYLQSKNASVPK